MKIHCPECQGIFRVQGQEAGTEFDCPFCKARFSYRDKQTVVSQDNPETEVRVEPDSVANLPRSEQPTMKLDSDSEGQPTPTPVAKVVPSELTDLKVGDQLGGYRLEEVIGWGGMSVVFRGTQLSLDRSVAVKILRKDLGQDPEFTQRFLKEAKALADLSHPHIVQVFDQGVHEGNHYLVMEFIDGVSLRDILSERRLSPEEALKIVPELCGALEYAHSKGIVHRDIKPENLMLSRDGTPKIADFGLVRMLGDKNPEVSRLTKTQTILGTLDYMAPEQREGQRDIDHRADIYSLGVVFYEMLTGELPIARFPLPSERVQVDVRLDEVVLKVLAKDRDHRYQRASMVATDLRQIDSKITTVGGHSSPPSKQNFVGRLLTMVQAPAFFIFTLIFLAVVISEPDEDVMVFFSGLALPFYLCHLVMFGILPRPRMPQDQLIYRRPLLMFGALVVFCLVLADPLEDAAPFLIAFFLSCGICLAKWRRKVFRQAGEPVFLAPGQTVPERPVRPAPAPPIPTPTGTIANSSSGAAASVSPAFAAGATPAGAKAVADGAAGSAEAQGSPAAPEPKVRIHTSRPSPIVSTSDQPAPAEAGPATATATTEDQENSAPRKRLSFLVVIGFLFTLVTLAYSVVLWVATSWFDWGSVLAYNEDISFREMRHSLVDNLWQVPPAVFKNGPAVFALGALIPLLLPGLLNLVALIPMQNPNKRGGMLLGVSWFLLILQGIGLLAISGKVHSTVDYYGHGVERGERDSKVAIEAALEDSAETSSPLMRLAKFHRAVRLRQSGYPLPLHGKVVLAEIAKSPDLSPLERMAALVTLDELYRQELSNTSSCKSRKWTQGLLEAAVSEGNPQVREGFIEVLSRSESSVVKELYWHLLWNATREQDHRLGRTAIRWWTESAPREAIAWFSQQYDEVPDRTLERWVENLERSRNHRFRKDRTLRKLLLEPLLQHETLSERVRTLIREGPNTHGGVNYHPPKNVIYDH